MKTKTHVDEAVGVIRRRGNSPVLTCEFQHKNMGLLYVVPNYAEGLRIASMLEKMRTGRYQRC